MKKIVLFVLLICGGMLSQLICGCSSIYPLKKDNLLNGQVINMKSTFPKELTLEKSKSDFKDEVNDKLVLFLIDDAAIAYADKKIDDLMAKLEIPYTLKEEDELNTIKNLINEKITENERNVIVTNKDRLDIYNLWKAETNNVNKMSIDKSEYDFKAITH